MSRILVPEPMTRFQCNGKGCCCKGWRIDFQPEEILVLQDELPRELSAGLMYGARVWVEGDGVTVDGIQLRGVGPDKACRFLCGDGACQVHRDHGPELLPHLCQRYPGVSFTREDDLRELHFDMVCPEVLARLGESDAPLEFIEVDPPKGHHIEIRAREPVEVPVIRLGGQVLTHEEFTRCRDVLLGAIASSDADALDLVSWISHGLARLANGDAPATFRVDPQDPYEPFGGYFESCVGAHDAGALTRWFDDYRRFVFDVPLDAGDPETLVEHLRYRADWMESFDPRQPELQGLLRRYLANRYFMAYGFHRTHRELAFNYGKVVHTLATACRLIAGLSTWLGRPVDRPLVLVGLGASELLWRSPDVRRSAMPWFGLDATMLDPTPADPTEETPEQGNAGDSVVP